MRISDWSSDVCSSDLGSASTKRAAGATASCSEARRACCSISITAPIRSSPRQTPSRARQRVDRSEEHTSELQSLMHISYAVFCLKKKKKTIPCKHPFYKLTYILLNSFSCRIYL